MLDKLITGAVAYRKIKGLTEWFLVKSTTNKGWELPKSQVRRGESSVSAIIRYMNEGIGVKASVLEEAGVITVPTKQGGETINEKMMFYLMQNNTRREVGAIPEAGEWVKYPSAKRKLGLMREQKILTSANEALKRWQQNKKGA